MSDVDDVVTEGLAALAAVHGVATSYWSQSGERVDVPRRTIAAVLRALGADPTDETSIAVSLRERTDRNWRRALPPVFIAVAGSPATCWIHVPHGTPVGAWVEEEAGGRRDLDQVPNGIEPRDVDGMLVGEATIAIPPDLPLGWHRLVADVGGRRVECPLVVTPPRLDAPVVERMWGLMVQLYSVRSRRSWGLGDLADLRDLSTWSAAAAGADFTLVNPLHAPAPTPPVTPSPYLPATRRFPSPLYLRIEEIPEFGYLRGRDRKEVRRLGRAVRDADAAALDRDAAWVAKIAALEIVRTVTLTPGRRAALDTFIAREGTGLVDTATWFALAESLGAEWRDWPRDLRHPRSPDVEEWRDLNRERVDFHIWVQWLLDEQLSGVSDAARHAGMRLGIVHDLAVGAGFDGADAWALQDVLARDVSVGAPPDMYNRRGQNWAQPPWHPDALAEAAFIPYRDMLRSVLRHAGGIRIDHILGLFRLWWIPDGNDAADGTYVAYDHDALIGILALEAQRAGAIVIGEDLGTVEGWVQEVLAHRGVLGTVISWFERREDGTLKPPGEWRRDALASVTVHDLPPTAGYLAGEHIRIRDELGLLGRSIEAEQQAAAAELAEWSGLLADRGLPAATVDETVISLHRLLAESPARLLGVGIPDLVGQLLPQNQPGTDREYPNWSVPLADHDGRLVYLEDLPDLVVPDAVGGGIVEAVSGAPVKAAARDRRQ